MGQFSFSALLGAGAAGLALGLLGTPWVRRILRISVLTMESFGTVKPTETPEISENSSPQPDWRPPNPQHPPFPLDPILSFDPQQLETSALYPLMISAVVPRPIAFISTVSQDGVGNLAPYSYFNVLSHCPPVLATGHCWSKGRPKDSLRNILDTGELVISLISDWFVESANHTSGPYDPSVNEMEVSGLTSVPSAKVRPCRVAESAINFECRVLHTYDLKDKVGATTCTVVLAEAVMIHIAEAVAAKTPNTGKVIVDPEKLRPMCRLGGNIYGCQPHLFEIRRPDSQGRYPGQTNFVANPRDKILGAK